LLAQQAGGEGLSGVGIDVVRVGHYWSRVSFHFRFIFVSFSFHFRFIFVSFLFHFCFIFASFCFIFVSFLFHFVSFLFHFVSDLFHFVSVCTLTLFAQQAGGEGLPGVGLDVVRVGHHHHRQRAEIQ
jgi:hypothetical protein